MRRVLSTKNVYIPVRPSLQLFSAPIHSNAPFNAAVTLPRIVYSFQYPISGIFQFEVCFWRSSNRSVCFAMRFSTSIPSSATLLSSHSEWNELLQISCWRKEIVLRLVELLFWLLATWFYVAACLLSYLLLQCNVINIVIFDKFIDVVFYYECFLCMHFFILQFSN